MIRNLKGKEVGHKISATLNPISKMDHPLDPYDTQYTQGTSKLGSTDIFSSAQLPVTS